jgi:hypothetical protein
MVGGQCLGVTAKSTRAEAAYLWARWFVHPDNIKQTTLAGTGIDPYWRSLFDDPQVQSGWTDGKNGTRIVLDQASHKTLLLPNIPGVAIAAGGPGPRALTGIHQAGNAARRARHSCASLVTGPQAGGYGAANHPTRHRSDPGGTGS